MPHSHTRAGASLFDMDRDELDARYGPPAAAGSPEEAEVAAAWRAMYDTTRTHCMHGPDCRAGPGCGVGRRVTRVHVLSGSVVRVWGVLEAVLARRENELSKMDRAIRVVGCKRGRERLMRLGHVHLEGRLEGSA